MAPPPPPPPPLIVAASSCKLGGSVCLFKREKIEDVDEDSVSGSFFKKANFTPDLHVVPIQVL